MILSNGRALSIDFRIFVNDLTNCIRFYYRQRLHYFRMEIFGFEYCEQVLNIILWKYRQWFEKYSIMSSLLYERFRMLLILIFHCSILSFEQAFIFEYVVECCDLTNILWACFHMNKLWRYCCGSTNIRLWACFHMKIFEYCQYCNTIYEQ